MGSVTSPERSRHIRGAQWSAAQWAQWLARKPIVRHANAPWLAEQQRLVVLAPHPDDEVLACGALLCSHVARGGPALVIAVTDGEGSHAGDSRWTPRTLADCRRDESRQGLRALGAGAVPVVRLGLPDGAVAGAVHHLTTQLEDVLQPEDVLLTTWRRDGHPDHEACGTVGAQVAETCGSRLVEAPVWMWHWGAPQHPDIPWGQLCAVAVSPLALARKTLAIEAHVSQREPRRSGEGPVLDTAILERARWSCEYFFVAGNQADTSHGLPLL